MSITLQHTGSATPLLFPACGFGTWQSAPGEVGEAVKVAIEAGYKHLDLAKVYENQEECGQGIRDGLKATGGKREDLWLTSKLWNSSHKPELVEAALDDTLRELGVDYLDLYLIHWPVAFVPGPDHTTKLFPRDPEDNDKVAIDPVISVIDTWKAMIALPKSKVRSIGVSNFTTASIDKLIAATGVTPAVHQIERHPLLAQPELVAHHKAHGITITAYSPLGNNNEGLMKLFDYPEIKAIAAEMGNGVTPAQVLISWGYLGGHSVIPKSVTPSRIQSNLVPVTLSADHIKRIEALGASKPFRFNVPINYKPQWFINVFNEPAERVSPLTVRA